MSTLISAPGPACGYHSFRRISVDEYHRMIAANILTDEDKVELLEGYVVLKMPRNPPHDSALDLLNGLLPSAPPAGWIVRIQQAITLSDSEPEPDYAIVRGTRRSFANRHPIPSEIGLLVEVSNSSLQRDRQDKVRIYGRAGIPYYWIVNIPDSRIEVYSAPSGSVALPGYGQRQDYQLGDLVPLILDGVVVAQIAVRDMLP